MLEESARPEDIEGMKPGVDDANEEHALVENRTFVDEVDTSEQNEQDRDTVVMAPQKHEDPPTLGPEHKQLTIGEYREVVFNEPTERVIVEADGEVYGIKKKHSS